MSLVDSQGNHPAAFPATHPGFAVANVEQCRPCHGSDLTGGIANTSCFTAACHHDPVPTWASAASHGAAAKRAPGNSGFQSCRICHGTDFSGGGAPSCLNNAACHGAGVLSPHPANWRPGNTHVHTDTDPANAPVCALCHFGEPNAGNHPPVAPPPGSSPGCFNNTLCHGPNAAPHPLGAAWTDPGSGFHGPTAKQDLLTCQTCHGNPGTTQFNGGLATTSCSAACHPAAKAHPIPWFQAPSPFPSYASSHRDSGNRDVACALCHKVDGPGVGSDPNAPSCFSASFNGNNCHSGGPGNANHAVPNLSLTHTTADQAVFDNNCSTCHSVTGTSPVATAPLCVTCHQAGSPLANVNCTSCHAKPPSGTAYPNAANRHAKHDALTNVTGICTACHTGLDSGSLNHYNRANARPGKDALHTPPGDVAFSTTYNARSGTASFSGSAFTCSKVSCHGGITTPRWDTGTIAVNTNAGCLACHVLGTAQGTPENNSPYSGLHSFHLGSTVNAQCTECHDMANGSTGAANHFAKLNTPQMEGPANQTVTFPGLVGATYDSGAQSCSLSCHGKTHTSFSWSGGAAHGVPFLDTAHTNVSAGTFASTCSACHFETGPTDKLGPTCTVCHTAGSPLSLGNCTSCHAKPPSGSAYPNIAGKHSGHNALAGVTGVCTACHTGLDSGTQAHYDRANNRPLLNALRVPPGDASFAAAYNAKSGTASFNSSNFTCSKVSCHGGQTTPHWRTGAINVDTDCAKCHILGTTEYNSYNSGKHNLHVNDKIPSKRPDIVPTCIACHDTARLAGGHFSNLATTGFEQAPGATLRTGLNYSSTTRSCTPSNVWNTGCHGTKTW
ncbi:MAG: hypothetical protein Kow00128_22370 [Deltaproteobacteria bacterium]